MGLELPSPSPKKERVGEAMEDSGHTLSMHVDSMKVELKDIEMLDKIGAGEVSVPVCRLSKILI